MGNCPHHDTVDGRLDDHEERLRSKRDRILSLEKDVENMNEKLDLIVIGQREAKEAIQKSDQWQGKIMAIFGTIMFLVQVGPVIAGWLK
jgi:hypothetical protein